ncbi:MAG: orotate phosphoribosyltransferase [Deltaproteobacteria bacterium]|nr:orotate phosphoribosyltransferase [Deltaproteobacteria bacterium]
MKYGHANVRRVREGPAISARRVAEILLRIQAIHCNLKAPFIFTSGSASPVYVDCRRLISYPKERREVITLAAARVVQAVGVDRVDAVAGGETAGIPFAAWIAEALGLPMIYVRKKPKGFGRQAQIEGSVEPGQRVILVEDLTTDAQSKINFCTGITRAGATVEHALVIFEYGCYPEARENLKRIGVQHHSLTTWADVLDAAGALALFTSDEVAEIQAYLRSPREWSRAHGGA